MRSPSKEIYLLFLQLLVFSALLFHSGCATLAPSNTGETVYVDAFPYNTLDDYGAWSVHGRFGRVWRPCVGPSWRPYYYGHWVWSMDGWLWMSYEPFGWITFHHGHWYLDPYFGWMWIPGNRWFPAVVTWMQFDHHIGWAPLAPPGVVLEEPWGHSRFRIWNFVETRYFQKEFIGNYVIRSPLPRPIPPIKVTKTAPDVRFIEKITKTRITPLPMKRNGLNLRKRLFSGCLYQSVKLRRSSVMLRIQRML